MNFSAGELLRFQPLTHVQKHTHQLSGSRTAPQARCGVQVKASLIVVLTRGGSTARLVAKYKPSIPVLTVAVPVLTTDSLTWTCSGEQPARQCLITRGLLPLLAEGSARATDTDTTDEIIAVRFPPCMDVAMLSLMFSSWCILSGDECKLSRALHPAIQDMLCLNQNASEAFS